LTFNNCHWEPEGTHHGACSMPVLIAFKWCVLNMDRNFLGRRLWIYFRGGYACHFEFIADRRPV
ncbi:MAG: hypothetical protein RB191_15485, partial [Terriglobia bacterium]|nr:hypothetical protein [Terriglobia bacterium]